MLEAFFKVRFHGSLGQILICKDYFFLGKSGLFKYLSDLNLP